MKYPKSEHLILLRQRAWLTLKDSHALEIELRTVSTKIDMLALADHLLQFQTFFQFTHYRAFF